MPSARIAVLAIVLNSTAMRGLVIVAAHRMRRLLPCMYVPSGSLT